MDSTHQSYQGNSSASAATIRTFHTMVATKLQMDLEQKEMQAVGKKFRNLGMFTIVIQMHLDSSALGLSIPFQKELHDLPFQVPYPLEMDQLQS